MEREPGGAATAPEEEVREYLRTTVVVTLALVVGVALHWWGGAIAAWSDLAFATAYLVGGWPIARASWASMREGKLSIDFLMGAAAVGAAVVGNALEGTILIFLFSLSHTLEAFAMGRTRHAISALLRLSPREATLVDEAGEIVGAHPVEALHPGQLILVRPGERIAADGTVRSGGSEVDQSAITGESMPVRRGVGDGVYAGTMNQGGSLVVEVTRGAGETMLAKIIHLVEEAREQRAPAQHFIDRFAHPYTVAVVAATALLALVPPLVLGADWAEWFYRAMTLLVVASPCALIISTPAAILSGIANGARHGVLFKGGAFLDLAGTIDAVAFDKTGTLTVGKPRLREISLAPAAVLAGGGGLLTTAPGAGEDRLLALAAAVERESEHHLARAVVEAAGRRGIRPALAREFEAMAGEGVRALVDEEEIWIGNETMAARQSVELPATLRRWSEVQASMGRSVVYAGTAEEALGAMSFGDALKPNAATAVRHLQDEGVRRIAVLSGDHPAAVRAIAAELGLTDVRAGLLPHEKVVAVRELAAGSRGIAMVGDGVNDAPAMAAATVGIAMGAIGTDVAIEAADIVLMGDDLEKVDYVIHLGKRARRVVRQNVYFSIGWMLLLVVAALTVGIPLTLAVVAHEGSTLLVAANGLRLLAGRPHASPTAGAAAA